LGDKKADTLIPKHLGFIMDGNRRWAKANNLPMLEGHRRGFSRIIDLADSALKHKVPTLTIYAFSTENWDRDPAELKYLMDLFRTMFVAYVPKLKKKGVRIKVAGRLTDFEEDIQQKAQKAIEETKDCDKLTLNIAFSYGGRPEIVDATKRIIADGLKPEEITEDKFAEYIYEAGQPNIDMITRTSGERRISGFMLWQAAYAEFNFIDINWPDFDKKAFDDVIAEYNRRERRFGK
jgi:undecaprenyl diphosphate synthase